MSDDTMPIRTDHMAPPGPRRLDLGVADLTNARALWIDLIGGEIVPDQSGRTTLRLSPLLYVTLQPSEVPGPTQLVVATDQLASVRDAAARLGLMVHEGQNSIVFDDARFGGGELSFVATTPTEATSGHPDSTIDGPARGTLGLRRADHICFAVHDLRIGAEVLEAAEGLPVLGGDGPAGARALVFRFPHLKVEMLAPTADDGPVARYLARRSGRSGIHHFTLFVKDVAQAVNGLTAAGVPTVDTDAETRATWHETFLRPNATDGLLVQLASTPIDHRLRLDVDELADIHDGRYSAVDYTMRRKEG